MEEQNGVPREVAYVSSDPCGESLDKMNKRLTGDLRSRIRRLHAARAFSQDWNDMLEVLQHLASVAMMEDKDTSSRNGTVWEREEVCVRLIVEEGKINMLLRHLADFKQLQYTGGVPPGEEYKIPARVYEQSMGVLLRCCFNAVESLQTLDMRGLMDHIVIILDHCLSHNVTLSAGDMAVQEALVIQYLVCVMSFIDRLNEDVIMDKMAEHGIVGKVLQHFENIGQTMDRENAKAYLKFFAAFLETETFKTKPAEFFPTPAEKKRIVVLEPLLKAVIADDGEMKKVFRPVSNTIIRYK